MKNILIAFVVLLVAGGAIFGAYYLGTTSRDSSAAVDSSSPTEPVVGGDRDEYGCIPSAGYSWCESLQKCYRPWEEECGPAEVINNDEAAILTATIRQALINKHGADAGELNISVTTTNGEYAQGGAIGEGGGGMWFAAKVNGTWQLVWDGNGIIECQDLGAYPEYPSSMIPECYNPSSQSLISR